MKSLIVLSIAALAALPAAANQELAQKKACMGCHTLQTKLVGPAFKDVAAKYAKDKDAVKKLSEKVMKGGKGTWGEMAMPPNNVTPAEAETLVKWVLTVK
jgi:cytochrome c